MDIVVFNKINFVPLTGNAKIRRFLRCLWRYHTKITCDAYIESQVIRQGLFSHSPEFEQEFASWEGGASTERGASTLLSVERLQMVIGDKKLGVVSYPPPRKCSYFSTPRGWGWWLWGPPWGLGGGLWLPQLYSYKRPCNFQSHNFWLSYRISKNYEI